MNNKIAAVAAKPAWVHGAVDIYVMHTDNMARGFIAPALDVKDFREVVSGAVSYEPTFKLAPTEAQQLMDTLWACGIRPAEGSGSAGSLAATEHHLKDMQRIVFGLLKPQGVE